MNLEFFIAKRLVTGKEGKGYVSRSIVNITTFGISLSLAVMIISSAVVTGFKKNIINKAVGFGGHIIIENMDSNSSYETNPISANQEFIPDIKKIKGIQHIQKFSITAGILKTKEDIQGIVLKGVGSDYDWSFFKRNLVDGNVFSINDTILNNNILISKTIANLLKLKTGDDVAMFFVKNPPRLRRFKIAGIYETGLEEDFDKKIVIGDIKHVQNLNEWNRGQISGFEISVNDFGHLDKMKTEVENIIGTQFQPDGSALRTQSIKDKYPQLFDWLGLVNINVWIILTLMLLVAGFNVISSLMILILERTNMIGLLTALGAQSASIRKIFIYQSAFLVLRGLLWGNIIGILLCFFQYQFHIIKLNQASYFINSVPINLNVINILLINIGTLATVIFMMVIPSMVISKISPDTTLRYD